MDARQDGFTLGRGRPGPRDDITDVPGVRVGHTTLVAGEGPLVVGRGPVRTGVTIVVPHDDVGPATVFAGSHRLNGNGELTGLEWIREVGLLTTPIGLTNTHSVGVVRDAIVGLQARAADPVGAWWSLPVVGETWDGVLNDINGHHVSSEHVAAAFTAASDGPVAQGNVGGGTGMICHGFKGGIGSASRVVDVGPDAFVVGVLVQANYGRRERLRVDGVPVGEAIPPTEVPLPWPPVSLPSPDPAGAGSIIVIVGTDAPLLPHQCTRLAQRAGLGVARMGGAGEHSSGDLFLAFATGNASIPASEDSGGPAGPVALRMIPDEHLTPMFYAVIEATEQAILNALLAARTMTGRDGHTAHALDHDRLAELMARYGRPTRGV
jgi:D-aminopeptidase